MKDAPPGLSPRQVPPLCGGCAPKRACGRSAGDEFLCPWRRVVAKSACLRFRLTAKTALASLLLLSNANPLRWALRWGPPSAAYWVENCRWCGSAAAPGFAEPTCPVQHMGYLIRPLRGHLPLKGKAFGRLIAAPTVYPEAILPLSQGPGPEWPAKYGEISEIRREGHTPGWLLLPLRGNSPSAPPLRIARKPSVSG